MPRKSLQDDLAAFQAGPFADLRLAPLIADHDVAPDTGGRSGPGTFEDPIGDHFQTEELNVSIDRIDADARGGWFPHRLRRTETTTVARSLGSKREARPCRPLSDAIGTGRAGGRIDADL